MKLEQTLSIPYNHPYLNKNNNFTRLVNEYEKYGKLVIGFDFDNTIFDVHNTGANYSELINILQDCKRLGFILCLFTAEDSVKKLQWKIQYCEHFGIKPDYVNESPLLGGITTKPFFNLLLDDRAGLESAYDLLKTLIKCIDDTKFSKERIE